MNNDFESLQDVSFVVVSSVFLKVRAVYFKADFTISGSFQCSASSVGAPVTYTSSTINFLDVEGPFFHEVGPSSVVWFNCCLPGYAGAFLQLLKCSSKLLAHFDYFTTLGAFPLLDGRFAVVLLDHSFAGEESGTLFALVLGFFYWTL